MYSKIGFIKAISGSFSKAPFLLPEANKETYHHPHYQEYKSISPCFHPAASFRPV
jgi:hypothetical protein